MEYSLKKGLQKGFISLLSIAGTLLAFTAFSDMTLWGLVEQYIKPVLGSLTVGGLITMLINWQKVRMQLKGKNFFGNIKRPKEDDRV